MPVVRGTQLKETQNRKVVVNVDKRTSFLFTLPNYHQQDKVIFTHGTKLAVARVAAWRRPFASAAPIIRQLRGRCDHLVSGFGLNPKSVRKDLLLD